MNNTKSVIEVKQTSDYTKFKVLKGNRPIKKSHLRFLKESISKHGDLGVPVIVNEKFEIIDGQHRIEALKELELPVQYIEKPKFRLEQVHVLNTNRKNWKMIEFMNCYADLGMKPYVRIKEFHRKYGFHITGSLTLALGYAIGGSGIAEKGGSSGGSIESFKRGEFIFKDIALAEDRAEKILMFKDIFYGYRKKFFLLAMMRLFKFEEYNHAEFLSKLKQQIDRLIMNEPATVNGYLRIFEDIYNYRRQGKKVGFFQDLKIRNHK